ncbi:MAG: FRG domain-containing protein [Brumimicrobium sp.]
MKEYKSELFGLIPEPESFGELIEILTLYKEPNSNVHMWRGQINIGWRVDHSAYRRLKIKKDKINDFDLVWYEQSLMKQATHRGFRRQNTWNLSDLELLAKLQHHGAATRLIDFSRNSFIALWFAVSENLNLNGILIGLNSDYLGGHESTSQNYDYPFELKKVDNTEHPYTFEPPVITPRIAAQHSQFVYSSLSFEKTGSLKLHENKDANIFISIKKELKSEIANILERSFDLRLGTLFPDIDGFGDANSHLISTDKMWRW